MSGLYTIWKLERRAWLEGPQAIGDTVRPDAVINPPAPMPVQLFADLQVASERAAPFTEVEFTDRHFVETDDTVVISYHASARHQRYRRRYEARCLSVYHRNSQHRPDTSDWTLIAHQQSQMR